MKKNIYNFNEEKFTNVIETLKELPKVNAPDDFEFNLMLKIQNGQFETEKEEKRQSKLLWILTPAALVVTTVILFIVFTGTPINNQLNPIRERGDIYSSLGGNSEPNVKKESYAQKTVRERSFVADKSAKIQNEDNSLDENGFLYQQYLADPLSAVYKSNNSYKLDNLINGKGSDLQGIRGATNVKKEEQSNGYFMGDIFPEKSYIKKSPVNDKKAVIDSLKNLDSRNDTLKLKKNTKR